MKLKSRKKQSISLKKKAEDEFDASCSYESDDYFAFIIGFTSGGFPYGVTHEEMEEIKKQTE